MGLSIAAGVAFGSTPRPRRRGAPLLLVHGAGGYPPPLAGGAATRCPGRRVIAVDLPGHGQAPPPGERGHRGLRPRHPRTARRPRDPPRRGGRPLHGGRHRAHAGARGAGPGGRPASRRHRGPAPGRPRPSLERAPPIRPGRSSWRTASPRFSFGRAPPRRLRPPSPRGWRPRPPGILHGDFTACDAFDVMDRLGRGPGPGLRGGRRRGPAHPAEVRGLPAGAPARGRDCSSSPGPATWSPWEAPDGVTGAAAAFLEGARA